MPKRPTFCFPHHHWNCICGQGVVVACDDPRLPAPPDFAAAFRRLRAFLVPAFNVRSRRVGGIRFLRVGRLQLTFCVVRKPVGA